jgi:hypothetical protein
VGAAALLAAAGYFSPALLHFEETGFGDWQQFQHQWEAAWVAVARWGEMPLWNPFHCGGVTLFGDPQAQVYGPLFWILFPLGTTLGLKVFLILHTAAGLSGMYLLARRELGVRVPAAMLAAVVWGGSGFFAWHGSGGHSAFLPFYFAPWLLMAWRRAIVDPRWCAAVAGIMALVLFEGGVYPFPYFTLLLGFDAAWRLAAPREGGERIGVVRAAVIAGVVALALGAFRLLPILETLSLYPRPTSSTDSVTFAEAIAMLTAREHEYRFGHEYVWAEYGTYIGLAAVIVCAAGALVAFWRGHRKVLFGALLFGALMLGHGSSWHPWAVLHELPPFDSLRVPSRFAVLFTFWFALLGALAIERMHEGLDAGRARRGVDVFRRAIPWLVVALIAADVFVSNLPTIDRWRDAPLPPEMLHDRHYHLLPASQYGRYASVPALGVSNRGCYTGMEYRAAAGLWERDVPQARIEGAGELADEGRTANTMWAEVALEEDATVVFNQTWAPGWKSTVGALEADRAGRIVVHAPAGEHRIVARYTPRELARGAWLSAFGFFSALLVALFARRERFERAGAWLGRVLGLRRIDDPDGA